MIYVLLTLLLRPLLWLVRCRAPATPQRILVIQTAKIGDAICTSPLLRELHRALPAARITVLCAPLTAPLFRNNPHVDKVLAVDMAELKGLAGKWRQMQGLRRDGYDTALCCNAGAIWPVVLAWAGIPRRIGLIPNYTGNTTVLAGRLWTGGAHHRSGRLVMDTYFDMLRLLGLAPGNLEKEVFASADAATKVAGLLPQNAPLIGIAISAGNKLKELGREKLIELAGDLLEACPDDRLVLLGTMADRPAAQAIVADLPQALRLRVVDSTGALGLDELPALIGRLSLFIGVDSGLTYMADALGIPLVSVAGPADMDDARPLGERAVIIRRDLPCAPCSHYFQAPYDCRIGTRECISGIAATEILAAALSLHGARQS